MIAEAPAPSQPAAAAGGQHETILSIYQVTGQLQLILAARRAERNAESARRHDQGNDM